MKPELASHKKRTISPASGYSWKCLHMTAPSIDARLGGSLGIFGSKVLILPFGVMPYRKGTGVSPCQAKDKYNKTTAQDTNA